MFVRKMPILTAPTNRQFLHLTQTRQRDIKQLIKQIQKLKEQAVTADTSTLRAHSRLIACKEKEKTDIEALILKYEGIRAKIRRGIRMLEQGELYMDAAELLEEIKQVYDEGDLTLASMAIEEFDELDSDLPGDDDIDDHVDADAVALVMTELEAIRALPEVPTRPIVPDNKVVVQEEVQYYI